MTDFRKLSIDKIKNDASLYDEFISEVKKYGLSLNYGCGSCWDKTLKQLINKKYSKMSDKANYILKKMYNGISFSHVVKGVTNIETYSNPLTDKEGAFLQKNHKAGNGLFDKFPVKKATKKATPKVKTKDVE